MLKHQVQNSNGNKTIVFINGAGVGSWMWKYQLEGIKDYRLVTFDLPGHGNNSEIEFKSISSTALDIIDIMKDLNISRVNLVGHSIGAQIILYLLENYPEIIDSAIIISGLNKKMKLLSLVIKPFVGMTMPLIKKHWFAKMQAKQLVLPDSMYHDYYLDSQLIKKSTLINILRENMNFEFSHTIVDGKKVIFIVGNKEKGMMRSSADKNKLIVKGSKLITLDAAHGIPYEQPKELNKIIIENM